MFGIFREQVVKRMTRSSGWSKVRSIHLKHQPTCQNCGKKKMLGMQVHHIVPFHINPDLELSFPNLITLCDNPRCHLDKGHLGYFRSWNVNVVEDCKTWLKKYSERPL